jgi:hypothetical protein
MRNEPVNSKPTIEEIDELERRLRGEKRREDTPLRGC